MTTGTGTPKRVKSVRRKKPKILICTPEITELPEGMGNAAHFVQAKGGGLGDISASLIRYLHQDARFELHVVLPKYDRKIRASYHLDDRELDELVPELHRSGVHLVTDSAFANLTEVYGDSALHPRVRRAEAFQRYIINQLLDTLRPDVVHCNDWMTALVPAAARSKGIKSLFTLHNVFTEKATPDQIDRSGIDVQRFAQWLYFEYFPTNTPDNWVKNQIDFTATGIFAADRVNTVSNTFLEEVVRGDFPDVIPEPIRRTVRDKFDLGHACGVLNAPNDTVDPRLSNHIVRYYVDDVVEKKRVNKQMFQEKMGLRQDPNAPLFFWPSRLYLQKGPELLAAIALRCAQTYGVQIAAVANGDPDFEKTFRTLASRSSGQIAWTPFRTDLSELGKAGADFVLMPSRYEPCGLPQMECPRFGTLPIARRTGGLKDTVFELDVENHQGNGFVFDDYKPTALEAAMRRAVSFFGRDEAVKAAQIQRIMRESFEQFNLSQTAKQYISIYESLIGGACSVDPASRSAVSQKRASPPEGRPRLSR